MTIEEAQTLIGQKVSVKDTQGNLICGVLTFVGYNEYFKSWGIQVTVDRMPVTNINLSDLKLFQK